MKMVSFANKQHIKNSHGVQWLLIANTHSTSVYIVLSVVFIFIIFWSTITIILLLTGQQYFQSYLFSNTMFANIILLPPFWKRISNFKKSSDFIWQFCSHSGLLWGFSFLVGMIGAMFLIIHFLVVSRVLLSISFLWRIFYINGYFTLLIQMTDSTHDDSNAFGIKHSWWQFCM